MQFILSRFGGIDVFVSPGLSGRSLGGSLIGEANNLRSSASVERAKRVGG